MHVNYPEDRVGMHLAILFLLLIGFILSEVKSLNWLLFGMLFFPISMIPKINLTTSVFSPDNRMSKAFFQDVTENLNSYSTVSYYPLQQLVYSYLSRDLDTNYFVNSERGFNHTSEVVLTKTTLFKDQDFLKNYNVIASNPESTFIAYKRKTPYKKEVIYNQPLNIIDSNDEYISIYQTYIPDSLRNRKLQFHIDGDLVADNIYREFAVLVYSTFDNDMKSTDYQYVNERWIHGTKKEFILNFNYAVNELKKEEHEIRIYIWNQKRENISLKNGSFQILELSD